MLLVGGLPAMESCGRLDQSATLTHAAGEAKKKNGVPLLSPLAEQNE